MPLSRRYQPEHDAFDACYFGMDFSPIIPPGVGITNVLLHFFTNVVESQLADADFTILDGPTWSGRIAYAKITGGKYGTDYQLQWTVVDTEGTVWNRVALVLVGISS